MIGDVAVHKPCPWVISLESNYHVSINRKQNDIASWRIVQRQVQSIGENLAFNLLEDGEIMAAISPC
jgi:hypothetical protein